jgi:2-oxoglutarate ferredoxin oxidoreductase subunit alpha
MDYLRMNHPEFNYLKYNKVQGQPFTTIEIKQHVKKLLEG